MSKQRPIFEFPEEITIHFYRGKAHPWRRREKIPGQAVLVPASAPPSAVTDVDLIIRIQQELPRGSHFLIYLPLGLKSYSFRNQTKSSSAKVIEIVGPAEGAYITHFPYPVMEIILTEGFRKNKELKLHFPRLCIGTRPGTLTPEVYLKLPGGDFAMLAEQPAFEILPVKADSLQVYASNNFLGNKLRFAVAAEQPLENYCLPDKNYEKKVRVKLPHGNIEYNFRPEDQGVKSFELDIPKDVIHPFSVEVCDPENGFEAKSNVVVPGFAPSGYQIFFGDFHLHSNFSDGYGEQEDILTWARDWKKLDFVALNEHIENVLTFKEWTQEKWKEIKERYNQFYEPGRFVTIGGFEFRSYCNFWCFDDEYSQMADSALCNPSEKSQEEIQAKVSQQIKKSNWLVGYHRLELIRDLVGRIPNPVHLLQLAHGKRPPEIGSEMFLERRDRVGFFGATDAHSGIPAQVFLGLPRNGQSGLTAIIAKELTREGIHEALLQRHCYATMGSRHLVNFELNQHRMGEDICLPPQVSREIKLAIEGLEPIEKIELVRNGKTIQTFPIGGTSARIEYVDGEKLSGQVYYFARTILEDGRMIWTSPVWVNFQCKEEKKCSVN